MSADQSLRDEAPTRLPDLAAIYQQHHSRLRSHALSVLPSHLRHEADSAMMTVFTRLSQACGAGQFRVPKSWEAYLVTAVGRACLDIVKTTRNDDEVDDTDPRTHRGTEPDPTADTAIDHLEHAARVDTAKAALDTLDERSRLIIISKYVHGLNNREIGSSLGLSGQRVGQLHDDALKQVREEVNRPDDE